MCDCTSHTDTRLHRRVIAPTYDSVPFYSPILLWHITFRRIVLLSGSHARASFRRWDRDKKYRPGNPLHPFRLRDTLCCYRSMFVARYHPALHRVVWSARKDVLSPRLRRLGWNFPIVCRSPRVNRSEGAAVPSGCSYSRWKSHAFLKID